MLPKARNALPQQHNFVPRSNIYYNYLMFSPLSPNPNICFITILTVPSMWTWLGVLGGSVIQRKLWRLFVGASKDFTKGSCYLTNLIDFLSADIYFRRTNNPFLEGGCLQSAKFLGWGSCLLITSLINLIEVYDDRSNIVN